MKENVNSKNQAPFFFFKKYTGCWNVEIQAEKLRETGKQKSQIPDSQTKEKQTY